MPTKRRRRAVISSIAPYRPPRIALVYRVLNGAFVAAKTAVGIWALYWFVVILKYLASV